MAINDRQFVARLSFAAVRCLMVPVGRAGVVVLRGSVGGEGAGLIESPKRELSFGVSRVGFRGEHEFQPVERGLIRSGFAQHRFDESGWLRTVSEDTLAQR